jgi:DNA polymerase-3 subunit gamma/tau
MMVPRVRRPQQTRESMSVPPTTTAPHTAIYRRWRAQTFAAIVGQEAVVETIRNAVRLERVGHAYLFVGPRGTGKTSLARILAKAVNCTDLRDGDACDACPSCVAIREGTALDVAEFDAASRNRVDDMRELVPRIFTVPADLRRKVFIVDEVQRIKEGWDVLLKVLEEPPGHVLFVFCTTDQSQIRPAVISRVQRFVFRPLTIQQIAGKLERILGDLGRRVEPDAIALIARLAAGGMRDAESMLDQLLSLDRDPLTGADVRAQLGMAEDAAVDAYLRSFVSGDALAGIAVLDALEGDGRDLRLFIDQAIERVRVAMRAGVTPAGRGPHGADDPLARADLPLLAGLARRLAGLDNARPSIGGIRLPLELLLLESSIAGPATGATIAGIAQADRAVSAPGAPRASAAPAQESPSGPSRSPRPVRTEAPAGVPLAEVLPAAAGHQGVADTDGADALGVGAGPGETTGAGDASSAGGAVPGSVAMAASAGTGGPRRTPGGPAEAPDEPESASALETLRSAWADVVAHVSRNPANRPLIAVCRPVRIDGNVVVLGFPEDQAFLRDIAERKHAALEEGVAHVLGTQYGVRCVSTNLEALPPLPGDVTAREVLAQARRVFAGDLADASEVE